jgi:N,N'-diacetylchitobiose transport system substrate-binding protein
MSGNEKERKRRIRSCPDRRPEEDIVRIRKSRSVRLAAVLAASSIVLAACGDDDDDGGEAAPAATEAPESAPAEVADTTAAPAASETQGETIRLWLNGGDTPDELVNFAIAEFNKIHPDVTVKFERQEWTGIVEKLTTSLSSSDSPDVVEFGNTQAQAFEAAGAVVDLTPHAADLGGDDLLQSLLEAGTYDGKLYAVPYYAGARIMIYRKDLFEAAGVAVPTTLDEMVAAGVALQEANADVPNFSGIYMPGKNWYAVLSFLWANGGDIATQENGEWVGQLDSPGSIAGLEYFKTLFDTANGAPADGDDANDYIAFCNGEVGMMPAPGWKPGQIINPDDGCPDMEANIGVFAMPGMTAGDTAPVFLGGSNLGIPTNSEHQDLALDLLKIMVSPEYQRQFAAAGTIPALKSELANVAGSDAAVAQATAAQNSRFVPTSEKWAGVEAANVLPDMLVDIAQGGDIASAAATADAAIEAQLNG